MEIKVLGGGCNNCDILKAGIEDVLEKIKRENKKVKKVKVLKKIEKLEERKTTT